MNVSDEGVDAKKHSWPHLHLMSRDARSLSTKIMGPACPAAPVLPPLAACVAETEQPTIEEVADERVKIDK
jgi:hypothetical protein